MKRKYLIILAMALFGLSLPVSAQTVIYEDSFDGSGELNGTMPVIGGDAPSWAQNATWVSSPLLTMSGGQLSSPADPVSSNAYLPAEIRVDSGIWTLETTYAAPWGAANSWIAVGFATSVNEDNIRNGFYSDSVVMLSYARGIGANWSAPTDLHLWVWGTTTDYCPDELQGVAPFGAYPLSVKITLDTYKEEDNLTLTVLNALVNGTMPEEGQTREIEYTITLTADQINAINAIKLGVFENQAGDFQDIKLTVTQIPEAGTASMVLMTAALAMAIRMRRTRR